MIEEVYSLDLKENSPVFVIPWFNNCRVLVDTGATLPIWLKSVIPLKIKGAVKMDENVNLNGVGGKVTADLYRVNFDLGNIHFKNLPVVHKELKVADAYMILPATLFDGMMYEVDNINGTFTIKFDKSGYYRYFKIKDTDGIPYVYLSGAYETEDDYNKEQYKEN
ncbi:MAG: hypothetical protein HFH79_17540 [Lachnospiraceae bacterium]|nr:hypothetical protein [Lachnospiraceae bacterium]